MLDGLNFWLFDYLSILFNPRQDDIYDLVHWPTNVKPILKET